MTDEKLNTLYRDAVDLLKKLIAAPSFSKEENKTADILENFFKEKNIFSRRILNNVVAENLFFDSAKPTILLNSHHDTVKPDQNYTLDPFAPLEKNGKLYGLGSNDAGGALVSLISTFLFFYDQKDLKYNLIIAATAEEEISGANGVEHLLKHLPAIDFGIVGEPTLMQMAVAEKGLLVLDCKATGKAGHAAREEGKNAITKAVKDITWFNDFRFPEISPLTGPVKMSVTSIQTQNRSHNIVPSECTFIVDVRVNELYSFEEILEIIRSNVQSEIVPRSTRLRATSISLEHPLIKAGWDCGRKYYGSPTTSDKALMTFPVLKMGPGDSARSHTADEFIFSDEIKEGIQIYIEILKKILQ